MFKEFVTGSYMSYERNPNYWDTATIDGVAYNIPFASELVMPIIPDVMTLMAALRAGKLDLVYSADRKQALSLEQDTPAVLTNHWPHVSVRILVLRTDKEPFNNKEVRRAVKVGLDLSAIHEALLLEGLPYCWPAVPLFMPLDELKPTTRELLDYNPEKARKMLADAGYPDGLDINLLVKSGDFEVDMAAMISALWADIGVNTTLSVRADFASYLAALNSGECECAITGEKNVNPLETLSRFFVLMGDSGRGSHRWGNSAAYDNPELTALVQEALLTPGVAKRDALTREALIIAFDDVPYINIGVPCFSSLWWPWVKNYYGEVEDSHCGSGYFAATIWIDQQLKEEMGFK